MLLLNKSTKRKTYLYETWTNPRIQGYVTFIISLFLMLFLFYCTLSVRRADARNNILLGTIFINAGDVRVEHQHFIFSFRWNG